MKNVSPGMRTGKTSGSLRETERMSLIGKFVAWRVLLTLVVAIVGLSFPVASRFRQFTPDPGFRQDVPFWVWRWANFDGVHYVTIAKSGYLVDLQPFFPLYPFTIRLVNELFRFTRLRFLEGGIVSGQLVSSVAFVSALFFITKLLRIDKQERLTSLMITTIFLFPTAFFYTAVYNDAMFFLFAVITIYLSRQRHWFGASIAGALATLTRLNGLALFFFILAEYIHLDWKCSFHVPSVRKSGIWIILAIPAAFIGYLFSVQRQFGDWRMVFTSMHIWGQDRVTFPLQVAWRYIKILSSHQFSFLYWIAALEFGFVLLHLILLLYSYKRLRVSYWLFFLISLFIPTLTGTFQGMPRYGLHLYPMFLVLTMWLSQTKKWIVELFYFLCIVGQIIFLSLFMSGYFIT